MATKHFHVYVAADDYRQGEYAPTAFQIVHRRGWRNRGAANRFAARREPDPRLRLVLGCTCEDCKLVDPKGRKPKR